MNPIAKKFASSEELFKELTTLVKLPKNEWMERIDNLEIKQIINSNHTLLLDDSNQALERLTALKKRLKKVPSKNEQKQNATLDIIQKKIQILANLSEDEEESKFKDIISLSKELESLRKLPGGEWLEKINCKAIKILINKNINILIDNRDKALTKLSQISNRLRKEPSSEGAQAAVQRAVLRAIELVSCPSDEEEDLESSSSNIEISQIMTSSTQNTSSQVSQQSLSTTSNTDLLQPSKLTENANLKSVSNESKPSKREELIKELNQARGLFKQALTQVNSYKNQSECSDLVKKNFEDALNRVKVTEAHYKEPKRPDPVKGSFIETVELAIKLQQEYVNLSSCALPSDRRAYQPNTSYNPLAYENINDCEGLDDKTLERLFKENKRMKYLWMDGCHNVTTLPINNEGYPLIGLYCSNCEKLKDIPYQSLPNLEIFDCHGSQKVKDLPPPSARLKILNIRHCIQFDVNLFDAEYDQKYPNLIKRDQFLNGYSDQAEMQLDSDKARDEEIREFIRGYEDSKTYDENAILQGIEKIKERWKARSSLSDYKQAKERILTTFYLQNKRQYEFSENFQANMKAISDGRPPYWKKREHVADILHEIPELIIKMYSQYNTSPLDEERYYDNLINYHTTKIAPQKKEEANDKKNKPKS